MANKYQEYRADHIRLAFLIAFMDSPATRRVDNFYISDGRRIRLERMADGRVVMEYLGDFRS